MKCPHCNHAKSYSLARKGRYACANPACRKQFSETSATTLRYHKMPVEKYHLAFEEFRKGSYTTRVAEMIGCNYRTAWRLRKLAIQQIKNQHETNTDKAHPL